MSAESVPEVSVVVPAYNAERYLHDCLLSILDQDGVPLEVLVVDDGSTDRTVEIASAFGAPVRCLRQANAGSAVARNHGVRESRGHYIAFCDADDLWVPGRLRQQIAFLEGQDHYHAACGRFALIDADAPRDATRRPELDGPARLDPGLSGWMYLTLLRDSVFHLDTLLVRRSVAERIAFDPIYRRGQDFDYFLKLSQATPIAQIDAVYAGYRQHEGSITRQPHLRNYRAEVTEAAVARWGTTDAEGRRMPDAELRRLLAQSWFSHGWGLYHAGWYGQAAAAYRRGLRLQPSHLRAWRLLMLCGLRRHQDRMPADARPA